MALTPNDSFLSQKKKKTPIYWLSYSKYEVRNFNDTKKNGFWLVQLIKYFIVE